MTLLALGSTAGITLAQFGGSGDDPPWASFASQVASILGLDEAQIYDAFDKPSRRANTKRSTAVAVVDALLKNR